jgi:hypothetical protein
MMGRMREVTALFDVIRDLKQRGVAVVYISHKMDEIFRRISFGIGRYNNEPVEHQVLERIHIADFVPQRKLFRLAKEQLGTVGSGNHFVDLFEDDEGFLWTGVHFGSRGFGYRTTMGFIALSRGLAFEDRVREGNMDAPPILFELNSVLGESYIEAMHLAGEYCADGDGGIADDQNAPRRQIQHAADQFIGIAVKHDEIVVSRFLVCFLRSLTAILRTDL